MRSTAAIVLGEVVSIIIIIVFGRYNCILASCYKCNNVRTARADDSASELCQDND